MQTSLITGRAPEKSFNFPAKVYKDNRQKSGEMRRFCLHEWLHDYPRRMLLQNPLYFESFENENRPFIFENFNCIFFTFQSNLDYFIKILTSFCNER